MEASKEEFIAVPDVGDKMADSLVNFFKEKRNLDIISELKELGINFKDTTKSLGDSLNGKTVVITGSFDGYDRKGLSSLVELHGGKASSSVSKKTDYILAGNEAGSKLQKGIDLGIEIIDLDKFLSIIDEGE